MTLAPTGLRRAPRLIPKLLATERSSHCLGRADASLPYSRKIRTD